MNVYVSVPLHSYVIVKVYDSQLGTFQWMGGYNEGNLIRGYPLSEMPKHAWPTLTIKNVHTFSDLDDDALQKMLDEWVIQYG